jgi:hypothetical protein
VRLRDGQTSPRSTPNPLAPSRRSHDDLYYREVVVSSEHFAAARRELPQHLAETPRLVNFEVPQDDWSELGELAVD